MPALSTEFINADAASFHPRQFFDLIVSFNAWYGIPLEKIKYYRNFLNPDGCLILLLNSEQSITLDLTRTFVEKVLSAEELIAHLKDNKMSHTAIKVSNTSLSKSSIIQDNSIDQKAEAFFHYVLWGRNITSEKVIAHLAPKREAYFQMPQYVVIIKRQY